MNGRRMRVVGFLIAAACLHSITPTEACGPFFSEPIFIQTSYPDSWQPYLRGELGILLPSYWRANLFVAYRYLAGKPLGGPSQQALLGLPSENASKPTRDWIAEWRAARDRMLGKTLQNEMQFADARGVQRWSQIGSFYVGYYNCLADSFRNAIETLEQRVRQYGTNDRFVQDWIAAQDRVYANCEAREPSLPSPAPTDSPAWLVADRAYQIAAAHFYIGNYDEARARFEQIAQDQTSPWRELAAYLIARCWIRKASLTPEEGEFDPKFLAQAEAALIHVLGNDQYQKLHQPAQRLLQFVRLRLRPEEQSRELASRLLQNDPGKNLSQDLTDYAFLLDRSSHPWEEYSPERVEERRSQDFAQTRRLREHDLTDWILTMQTPATTSAAHAVQQWQAKRTLPWLVAALAKASNSTPRLAELLADAGNIQVESPGFLTVAFHRARLLAESGDVQRAREVLDTLQNTQDKNLTPSGRNLVLALRMKLASTLSELLRYAARVPAAVGYRTQVTGTDGIPRFDQDAAVAFSRELPLRHLLFAVEQPALPNPLRGEVAVAAWTRAVLLGRHEEARQIMPLLGKLEANWAADLDSFRQAPDNEARLFTASFLILKHPGMSPIVRAGRPREKALAEIDSFRDNWWCKLSPQGSYYEGRHEQILSGLDPSGPLFDIYKSRDVRVGFLTAEDLSAASSELVVLKQLPTAPNYLTAIALEWAKKHPYDPRASEALHRAVRSTRYGCTDAETGSLSRAAFELLHRRYPKSPWTKRTPYWFAN